MSTDEYRQRARQCFQIAETTTDSRHKLWLIDMAQYWLALANQAEKNLTTNLVYETPPPRDASSPVAQQQEQIQPKKDE